MSSLTYKTMWFGIPMYLPGYLRWFASFKPSSGFLLGTGLQGLTSANLPHVMSFSLLLSHSASAPLIFFEFFESSSVLPLGLQHTLFPLPGISFLHFIWSPEKLPVTLKPKSPPLALASITFICSLSSQHVFTTLFPYSLVHLFLFYVTLPWPLPHSF